VTLYLDPERRVAVLVHELGPRSGGVFPMAMLPSPEPEISKTYSCRGCHKVRTFVGPTEKLVGLQIASAGWKVDGPRGECPSCWLQYEASVLRAARGNS
jgi:hypothetical protein